MTERMSATEAICGLERMLEGIQHLQHLGQYKDDVRFTIMNNFDRHLTGLWRQGMRGVAAEYAEKYADLHRGNHGETR